MTQDPTPYDLLQDAAIEGLQDIVTPYYQPPGDQEYSFPVVGQGVSSEMFQQISRAAGAGVYVQHDAEGAQSPYRLTGMPSGDSETNAQNTMMLRTSNVTGRSEAAISGFFHTQTENMVISFPPVTTPTTYYLALTYDPRREEEESGPIRIEVHANDLPTTHGRKHIVLYTVRREPNQLLTNATITRTLPWLGHVINVWHESDLPEPTSVEYGTLAVVINPSGGGANDQPEVYTSRGNFGWVKVVQRPGPWQTLPLYDYDGWQGSAFLREELDGIRIMGNVSNGRTTRIAQLPSQYALSRSWWGTAYKAAADGTHGMNITDGRSVSLFGSSAPGYIRFDQFISSYYF